MLSVEKEIGAHLRQARESMGLSLEHLQEKTNIQKSFITSIENGNFDKLPSPFYVRTYLRAYCKCVKIEPHHILRQYRKVEQAERGLTSVHQAITPEMLAQTQQMYQNGGLNQNLGQTMLGNTQNLGNTQQTRVPRTNVRTALTIAKGKPTNHQQQANMTRKETVVRQTTYPNLTQKRSQSTLEHTTRLNMREQLRKPKNELISIEEKKQPTIPPKRQVQKTTASTTPVKTGRKRSVNSKESLETAHSPILERGKLSTDISKQDVSQLHKLSRSAVRSNRRASSGFSFRWPAKKSTLVIIASVVICIPLLWATVAALAGDDEETTQNEQTETTDPQVEEPSLTVNDSEQDKQDSSGNEDVVLANTSPQENTYEVSGTDQIKIQFQARDQSWVQVRNQRNPQKEGFLDEATLQSGDKDQYEHLFSDSEEIWISLGMPEVVDVMINGKTIKSAKTIHIKKK